MRIHGCSNGRPVAAGILVVLVGLPATSWAADRLVPSPNYPTIQSAIDACNDGDVVILSVGSYTGDGNRDLDFDGKPIIVRGTDPNDPNAVAGTVIDCQGTEGDPHRGFTFTSGEDPNSVVTGLTIKNGYGPQETLGPLTVSAGGAIYCSDASPTITGCIFVDNLADDYGGAVYCTRQDANFPWDVLLLTDCDFNDNEGGAGGALYCETGWVTLDACSLAGNASLTHGGAVCCLHGSIWIGDCLLSGNTSLTHGGAVYSTGRVAVADSTLCGNSSAAGGAICGANLIIRCTIAGNTATSRGGAIYCDYSEPTIDCCTIANNVCDAERDPNHAAWEEDPNTGRWEGGGLYFRWFTAPRITSCIISNNRSALDGGGIYCSAYIEPIITNCTIAGNQAANLGGGIFCDDTASPTINNSILWENVGTAGTEIVLQSKSEGKASQIAVSYSDVAGDPNDPNAIHVDPNCTLNWGAKNIDIDPLFVDPDGPDGDPNTWQDNDHHLAPGSPCINAGDPNGDYEDQTDIDGQRRVNSGRVEIGADEYIRRFTCGEGSEAMLPLALGGLLLLVLIRRAS